MKPFISMLLFICISASECYAQSPQFAVVKPSGTTTIYTSWMSAYNAAENEDFIYLPGASINGTITIDKRLHIYGAGHHPDSTSTTGKTIFSNQINITGGASGGSLEGVRVNSNVFLGGESKLTNYSIKRCYFISSFFFDTPINDSVPENCTILETVLSNISSTNFSNYARNNLFIKNIITNPAAVSNIHLSTFSNNIFTGNGNVIHQNVTNTIFQNNIFLQSAPVSTLSQYNICYNSYLNNLKLGSSDFFENSNCPNQGEEGNVSVTNIDSIFVSYTNNGFNYANNYQLKSTCPGVDAGTDDTDLGIYGTNNPTPAGWVPSNPHIYFKQVDAETGPDGRLHIQVGVRPITN